MVMTMLAMTVPVLAADFARGMRDMVMTVSAPMPAMLSARVTAARRRRIFAAARGARLRRVVMHTDQHHAGQHVARQGDASCQTLNSERQHGATHPAGTKKSISVAVIVSTAKAWSSVFAFELH